MKSSTRIRDIQLTDQDCVRYYSSIWLCIPESASIFQRITLHGLVSTDELNDQDLYCPRLGFVLSDIQVFMHKDPCM